jgi:hypothetical protein
LTLFSAFPALSFIVSFPTGKEPFSEFWILDAEHMGDQYPFNITSDRNYTIYVGVGDHMTRSAYYAVYVKFRNQSESLPNATSGTPSQMPPLYEYLVLLEDEKIWESQLTFSFHGVSFVGNTSFVRSLVINGVAFDVDGSAVWSLQRSGFYYQLFMELWIYNSDIKNFQFHNRYVALWLNVTLQV